MVVGEGDTGIGSGNEDVVKTEDDTVLELVRKLEEAQAAIDSDVDGLVLDTNPVGQKAKLEKAKEKTRVFHKKQLAGVGDRNVIISNLPDTIGETSYYPIVYYEKGDSGQIQNISVGFLKTTSKKHLPESGIKSRGNQTWRQFWGGGRPDTDILDYAAGVNASHLDVFSEQKKDYDQREAVLIKADESAESTGVIAHAFLFSIDGAKRNLQEAQKQVSVLKEVPIRILQGAIKDIFGTESTGESSTATPFPPPPAANRPAGPTNPTGQ